MRKVQDEYISIELLYKKLENSLSEKEKRIFETWIMVPEHCAYFEHLKYYYELKDKTEVREEEIQEAWHMLQERMRKRPEKNKFIIYKIVAVILLVFGIASIFLRKQPEQYIEKRVTEISPGQQRAILRLANGRTYHLEKLIGQEEKRITDHIRLDSCWLACLAFDSVTVPGLVYNTLEVPRGGEFQLILPDGSKVWLNAESVLKYPENFSGNCREVFLQGEAYFEVASNEKKPFVVNAGIQKISVLGTSFGISNYPDCKIKSTTLVSGKVKVEFPGLGREVFYPDSSCQVFYDEQLQEIKQKAVDVREYVAWHEGVYVFKCERLEDMLTTLSRWYDFHIFYRDPVAKDLLFSGELMRFTNFREVLGMIEKASQVRFLVKGKTVSVGME